MHVWTMYANCPSAVFGLSVIRQYISEINIYHCLVPWAVDNNVFSNVFVDCSVYLYLLCRYLNNVIALRIFKRFV